MKGSSFGRRQFMRCFAATATTCLLPSLPLAKLLTRRKPNIVYINADDLGWTDPSCQGSDFYRTPHLDKLAAQGAVFTNAYAPAANCAPSRACCMTGRTCISTMIAMLPIWRP